MPAITPTSVATYYTPSGSYWRISGWRFPLCFSRIPYTPHNDITGHIYTENVYGYVTTKNNNPIFFYCLTAPLFHSVEERMLVFETLDPSVYRYWCTVPLTHCMAGSVCGFNLRVRMYCRRLSWLDCRYIHRYSLHEILEWINLLHVMY